ncbi:efflux transporter outer membrane subunit [Pseudomonas monteilii]|uniref:efflux transporter outer membrane subunit n=1 Tax=Pseudomonas monteilii TaxID=76759 RepID=UPI0023641BB6|nr:efflux transporter outer membrane subunit [Pseudomonas monteilii]EKT9494754.1 efflux transporter outer membrane subunit [Pseudomonas aeruginosa]MDD2127490.1 efflux transporter outer membrane subunit [Pseudomonas monteilii]
MKMRYLVLAVSLALGGCSLIPDYERPQISAPSAWPQGAAYAEGRLEQADGLGWQEVFHDPALRQLIGTALENNLDLRQAALNVEAYRARYRIQRSELLPNVDVGAQGNRQRLPGDLSPTGEADIQSRYDVSLGLSYELDLFGRLRSLSRSALERYLASEEARQGVQIALVADVAQAYLTWRSDQDQLILARSTLQSYEGSLTLIEARYQSGTASDIDVRQARSLVSQARVYEAMYTRLVAQDVNALELLLGTSLPRDLPAAAELSQQWMAGFFSGLPSDLLLRRPDIRAAEHQLRAANADIGAARAAFFPSIGLSAAAGTASAELDGLFEGGSGMWQFMPRINIPIFNAGRLRANLDYAEVRRDINVARYEQSIQTAFREVADGLAARGTYGRQLQAQQELVDNNKVYYRLARQRYTEGVDSYLAVLDAQRELFRAEQQLILDRLGQLSNEVLLFRAIGGGVPPEGAPPPAPNA